MHTVVVLGGACSLARPHQPRLWCGRHRVPREQGPRRFGRKLDSEDGGEHPGEACRKARRRPTCAWGRPEAIHGVTRPGAWPLRGIPCEGLQRGLGGSLRASRYLGKNTGVVNESLHLYRSLPSAFIFATLVMCFTFPSLVVRLVDRVGT